MLAAPIRKTLETGIKNIGKESLVDPGKVLLPSLHVKSGLTKLFVKALPKKECFKYLCDQFPGLAKLKCKKGNFVRPNIRKI